MSTVSKYKWFLGIILGGTLLILAMAGGSWHTTYAASGPEDADPIITFIYPSAVPVGSNDVMMIIAGQNFGYIEDFIRVQVTDDVDEYLIAPMNVIPNGIGVVISDTLLVSPNLYTIRVLKSNDQSIPPIPPDPIYDHISNPVDFLVYEARFMFLPLITRIH